MGNGKNSLESVKESSLGDWQRMIVHDMKSPLAVILANLDLLSRCRLRAREEEFLESALRGCHDLQRMIQGYLRITRLGERGPSLELCVIRVVPFFRRLEGMWSVLGRERGASLELDLGEAPDSLVADEHLLERILSNLVLNAVAHVERGGRVGVRVRTFGAGRIRISVSDDGAGMPDAVKRALVRPLPGEGAREREMEQGHSCRRRSAGSGTEGTGIGLAFCRLACGLHGGRVWVEEESADGTVVHVELPMNLVPSGSGLLDGPKEDQTGDGHGIRRS